MKRLLATIVVLLLLPLVAAAEPAIKKQYPGICTDQQSLQNAVPAGFIPCDWWQAGTGALTPSYVRVVDQNSALTLDVLRLSSIVTGISTAYRAAVGASALMALDTNGMNTFRTLTLSDTMTDALNPRRGLNINSVNFLWNDATNRGVRWRIRTPNDTTTNATLSGAPVVPATMFWNTAINRWQRWQGRQVADNLTNAQLTGPAGMAANMFWHIGQTRWYRDRGSSSDSDAVPTTTSAPYRLGLGHRYLTDGDVWARIGGETADGGDILATQTAGYGFSLEYVWDGGDWKVMGADANGDLTVNQTTTNPGFSKIQDQDGTDAADVIAAGLFNLANTLNGLITDARNYGWDGAAWDPFLMGATGELQQTDVAVRPGENASLFAREGKVSYLGTTEPGKTGPTAVADVAIAVGTGAIILGPTQVLDNGRFCVYVRNVGGGSADAFSDVEIHDSPDGTTGWVITNTWTSCDALAAGTALCKYCSDDAIDWIQVKARCAGGDDTTADAWLRQVKR